MYCQLSSTLLSCTWGPGLACQTIKVQVMCTDRCWMCTDKNKPKPKSGVMHQMFVHSCYYNCTLSWLNKMSLLNMGRPKSVKIHSVSFSIIFLKAGRVWLSPGAPPIQVILILMSMIMRLYSVLYNLHLIALQGIQEIILWSSWMSTIAGLISYLQVYIYQGGGRAYWQMW